jgi:hypothetical protein
VTYAVAAADVDVLATPVLSPPSDLDLESAHCRTGTDDRHAGAWSDVEHDRSRFARPRRGFTAVEQVGSAVASRHDAEWPGWAKYPE